MVVSGFTKAIGGSAHTSAYPTANWALVEEICEKGMLLAAQHALSYARSLLPQIWFCAIQSSAGCRWRWGRNAWKPLPQMYRLLSIMKLFLRRCLKKKTVAQHFGEMWRFPFTKSTNSVRIWCACQNEGKNSGSLADWNHYQRQLVLEVWNWRSFQKVFDVFPTL